MRFTNPKDLKREFVELIWKGRETRRGRGYENWRPREKKRQKSDRVKDWRACRVLRFGRANCQMGLTKVGATMHTPVLEQNAGQEWEGEASLGPGDRPNSTPV